jgi:hypothetical protein
MASGLFHHSVPVDVGEEAQTKPEIVEKSMSFLALFLLHYEMLPEAEQDFRDFSVEFAFFFTATYMC